MNTVMLIGTLTRDPELKEMDKTKICDMRLVEANGRRETPLYIDVSTFGRQAEICGEYLSKGRQVAISGQLRFREWEADDGSKHSMHTIAAEHVDFLNHNTFGNRGKGGKKGGRPRGGGGGGRGNGNGREGRKREGAREESGGREGGGREGREGGGREAREGGGREGGRGEGGREARGREGRGRERRGREEED